jgi:glycosyltransferase involved in cell wall biosynthesis
MRIGFDAKRAFYNQTGLGNYSRFVINALLKNYPENYYHLYASGGEIPVTESVDFHKLKSQIKKKSNPLWRTWLINNDLQRDSINIFHGLSNEIPFRIHKTGIKSVVTIHDLIFLRYPELYPAIDRWIYNQKFRYACQNADAIVAVSEQTKRDIVEFYKISEERIRVIYQGIGDSYSTIKNSLPIGEGWGDRRYGGAFILCVGTITERKNQLTLVKAFEALNLPDYELILVGGKTNYQTQIETYIQNKQLKNIKILNNVNSEQLTQLYQQAELFVYPSVFEGFGIPIVEAIGYNLPVVSATGSCLEEAGGGGAVYANPLNFNDLADKINQVLQNESLRKQLIQNGKEHIKKFSPDNIASELNTLYHNI